MSPPPPNSPKKSSTTHQQPVVADLCCGMGGLSLAASQIGLKVSVGVDLSPKAVRTYKNNFPNSLAIEGSVRSTKVLDSCGERLQLDAGVGGPRIIVSGPPCQGFSMAGSRDPADPRNQILNAVARSIVRLAPECALIENVAMVLSDRNRERVSKFEETLADGGYCVASILVNAVDFGVPQRRKRAFFLITKKPIETDLILSELEKAKKPILNVELALEGLPTPSVRPDDYSDENAYEGVANHFAMRHSEKVMEKIAALLPGTGPMSYRRLHPSRPSNTLFSGHRAPPAHFSEPRSITVREAARLQGFPDTFRVFGTFGNQMEQVTNAVPPPLAAAVLKVLVELAGVVKS